jgi:hypothetical protein
VVIWVVAQRAALESRIINIECDLEHLYEVDHEVNLPFFGIKEFGPWRIVRIVLCWNRKNNGD